uniref:Uncharacterized protein MANES_17G027400 n=1 Tax=Rhizophora mucronata TaxID=61149 RepID=A0A2P2QWD5_RHIMU
MIRPSLSNVSSTLTPLYVLQTIASIFSSPKYSERSLLRLSSSTFPSVATTPSTSLVNI